MSKGQRLDVLVVERGLFSTREAARAAIMDGAVLVDGLKVTKPGMNIAMNSSIDLIPGFSVRKFASRGGLKLEKALEQFHIGISDRICLDIGASTGGFTDCLLKGGASRVYAVDVGYGQLDWQLRNDNRVVVKERMNARHLNPQALYANNDPWADFAVIDVSFISVTKVVLPCLSVMPDARAEFVCLIKPQFEAGRAAVGKGGVVRDPRTHVEVLESTCRYMADQGLVLANITHSPIKGPAGNIEFLIHLRAHSESPGFNFSHIVERAHSELS